MADAAAAVGDAPRVRGRVPRRSRDGTVGHRDTRRPRRPGRLRASATRRVAQCPDSSERSTVRSPFPWPDRRSRSTSRWPPPCCCFEAARQRAEPEPADERSTTPSRVLDAAAPTRAPPIAARRSLDGGSTTLRARAHLKGRGSAPCRGQRGDQDVRPRGPAAVPARPSARTGPRWPRRSTARRAELEAAAPPAPSGPPRPHPRRPRPRDAVTCTSSPRSDASSRTSSWASGYRVAEGPEVEDDWHNFEALNFPPGAPGPRRCRTRST